MEIKAFLCMQYTSNAIPIIAISYSRQILNNIQYTGGEVDYFEFRLPYFDKKNTLQSQSSCGGPLLLFLFHFIEEPCGLFSNQKSDLAFVINRLCDCMRGRHAC